MQRLTTAFVLAYHGCEAETAEALIAGEPLTLSENEYDWLGTGAYFWEADPKRGLDWAHIQAKRGRIKNPAVVGAALDLGLCLDLTTQKSLAVIRTAYENFKAVMEAEGLPLPVNQDELRRELDCRVLNFLYETLPQPKFQTARSPFSEGGPLFDGSYIPALTHVQIAVRDLSCIKGVFRVPADQLA